MHEGLATYDAMRAFADSWGLLFMTATFIVVVVMVLRPGISRSMKQQAEIPFRHEDAPAPERGDEDKERLS